MVYIVTWHPMFLSIFFNNVIVFIPLFLLKYSYVYNKILGGTFENYLRMLFCDMYEI
jgi:hypothetical protein